MIYAHETRSALFELRRYESTVDCNFQKKLFLHSIFNLRMFFPLADRQPFQIRFLSDAFENQDEVDPTKRGPNAGVRLAYFQTNKGCGTGP